MSERLRLNVVVQAGTAGGAERLLLDLLEAAADRVEVTFDVLANGPLIDELWRFGPVRVVPTGRDPRSLARAVRVMGRRWQRAETEVVLANGIKAALVAIPAGRLAGIRVAWFKHDFTLDRELARPLGYAADAVVATNGEVAAATGRRDAVVVTPPRPEPPLRRDRARARLAALGLPRDAAPVVAAVGRLVPYKGVDDLIEALALPDAAAWRLAVVGEDDPAAPGERLRLERLAAARGVGDRVAFLGAVPFAGRLLRAFDAVAVATKVDEGGYGREGYGLVAAEAMAAGVPVIATPGPPADRLDGAGIVVPAGAPAAIAEALAKLGDARLRASLGARGRRLAAGEPDVHARAGELVAALAATAGRPGAGLADGVALSVVTTVVDEGPAVDELLALLVPQLHPADELVVVDGGSRDDTLLRLRGWQERDGRIRVVEAPGTTIGAGRNVGVRAARNPVLACTDAGCRPWPDWLDSLRRAFAERLPPDLVTGVYVAEAATPFEHAMAAACYPSVEEARRPRPLPRLYGTLFGTAFTADMPTGRSVAFTRTAWERVGGFREELSTAEDVTFGRAIAAGGRCALSLDAGVSWRQRRTARDTATMYYRYAKGGIDARDGRLVLRDVIRAAAYLAAAVSLARGGRPRRLFAVGAVAYTSLPMLRARRRPRPLAVALRVPAALALKDLSKAAGMAAAAARSAVAGGARRRSGT